MPMTVRYTVVDGEIIAEKRSGTRSLYVPDPHGSTIALLNSAQTITDVFSYWAYGINFHGEGSNPTPFIFLGTLGYYKDDVNREYVRARVLDKVKARWITPDPMGFRGGDWNLYRYAHNSPLVMSDVTGRQSFVPIIPIVIDICWFFPPYGTLSSCTGYLRNKCEDFCNNPPERGGVSSCCEAPDGLWTCRCKNKAGTGGFPFPDCSLPNPDAPLQPTLSSVATRYRIKAVRIRKTQFTTRQASTFLGKSGLSSPIYTDS
jgi:RHS repeat-associated protein